MNYQRGNVLFLILIAVALFAALSYAVTKTSEGGGPSVSTEKTETIAGDYFNYMTAINTAVTRMRANGVQDYELNFRNSIATFGGNDNTNCTANRCRIFHPAGGGVSPRNTRAWSRPPYPSTFGRIFLINVPGAGTAAADLAYIVYGSTNEICRAVNKRSLGLDDALYNAPITENAASFLYNSAYPTGPFTTTTWTLNVPANAGTQGTFCVCNTASGGCVGASTWYPALVHVIVAK